MSAKFGFLLAQVFFSKRKSAMGSLRFELRSMRSERTRMVQATLRPLGVFFVLGVC